MLLVLLLVVAGLAGAIAPQTAAAKEFVQIKIGGMSTTAYFATYGPVDIPGLRSGWIECATQIHTKRSVILHDVVLEGDIEIEGADLTVVLYGKNKMTGRIKGAKDITITDGNGSSQQENSLIVNGILSEDGDIQIDGNCFVKSKREIRSEEGYVTIKNATVHVASRWLIGADDGIKLIGVSVLYASPGTYWKPLEKHRTGDPSNMYRLVNTEGEDLWEVLIGPSGAPSEPPFEVLMEPESIEFSAIEGTEKVKFSMRSFAHPIEKGDIKVIEKPDWILCEPDAEYPNREMILRVPNNYGRVRSGEVVFEVKGI